MEFLERLGIKEKNFGGSTGTKWYGSADQNELKIKSPTNGKYIASVYQVSEKEYDTIIEQAQNAFSYWRKVPAPKRGEIVRQIGNRLREFKPDLGRLVSYEM